MARKLSKATGRAKKVGSAAALKTRKAVRKAGGALSRHKTHKRQGKLGQVAGAMKDAVGGVIDTVTSAVTGRK
jgi:hypothetical protein